MSNPKRIVHLKQSGELLTDKPGERWTVSALRRAAERLAEVQQNADRLGVAGLMVVSGGGNAPDGFGRGANMREQFGENSAIARYSDVIGRRSTIDNSIMLTAALIDAGVPHVLMAAPNSGFDDPTLGRVTAYDSDKIQEAYRAGKIVVMAGGIGKDGRTTDAGVVELTLLQAKAHPEIPSLALKSTKFNGVFDSDPAKHADARQYAQLSAKFMLADYDRFSAVDRRCLEIMAEAGENNLDVELQVYAAEYTIAQALENEKLGTTIFSRAVESVFA